MLSPEDGEALWLLLQRHAAPHPAAQLLEDAQGFPDGGGQLCLDYDRFSQARGPPRLGAVADGSTPEAPPAAN